MTCPEYEQKLQDVEFHREQLTFFLFHKELHLLSDAKAKQSANAAAFAVATASNELHRHQQHCKTCKQEIAGAKSAPHPLPHKLTFADRDEIVELTPEQYGQLRAAIARKRRGKKL
jgi:hypothetical protein